MARPKTIQDVKDRREQIATIYTDKISTSPILMKQYAAFLEAAMKLGGNAETNYSSVNVYIPKDTFQLQRQLEYDQNTWDNHQKLYERAVRRDELDELREWEIDIVKRHAEQENLPNPYDVFATNDEELQKVRADLGMEN